MFLYLKTDKKAYAWPYFWLEVNCFDTTNKCDITMRVWEIRAYKMAAWYPATLSVLIQQILFIMARAAATNFSWGGELNIHI